MAVVARPTATTDRVAVSRPEVTAYIALGANLGEPAQALRDALRELGSTSGVRLVRASSLYRTAPVDSSGPDYLNAVAEISTTLTAPALLDALQAIEQQAGRERPYRNAPRTLDLDLLLYGQGCIASPRLTVPHPRMSERAFVLVPLVEIAPTLVSPLQLQGVADQAIEPTGQEWASR
ncbi:MAG: 2-amino-4-hydroxy-6-hydroxymethyldihydropteridine diphosphokinase [Hydrogenophaga sp.]|nr:2-amino-4-hydroxy-6-hydroxymethyldihydropteridine diphosphokinase [Hydrogenophaga sp.]